MTKPEVTFEVHMEDGRVAQCWQAASQPYSDCVFSAGLVKGIEPDTLYLQLARDGEERALTLFLRPDEMLAITWICNGALWSQVMMEDLDE